MDALVASSQQTAGKIRNYSIYLKPDRLSTFFEKPVAIRQIDEETDDDMETDSEYDSESSDDKDG